jgi:hypothetical protein
MLRGMRELFLIGLKKIRTTAFKFVIVAEKEHGRDGE